MTDAKYRVDKRFRHFDQRRWSEFDRTVDTKVTDEMQICRLGFVTFGKAERKSGQNLL